MIAIMIGLVLGAYMVVAGSFYAYMNLAAQPEPEGEWGSMPSTFQIVEGGLVDSVDATETRKAA